jgi:hypothetical protein
VTVADGVKMLLELPQDLPLKLNWEGEIVEAREIAVIDVLQYHPDDDHGAVDYYPELKLDYGETRYKAVLID